MAEKRLQVEEIASVTGLNEFQNAVSRKDIPVFADMANNELVQKAHVLGYIGGSAIVINIPADPSYLYTLTAPQLAAVNSLSKIPNFVGIVNGEPFLEIKPIYTGGAGAYTNIDVRLNTDSDDTLVQFS